MYSTNNCDCERNNIFLVLVYYIHSLSPKFLVNDNGSFEFYVDNATKQMIAEMA